MIFSNPLKAPRLWSAGLVLGAALAASAPALAADDSAAGEVKPQTWAIHGQTTFVEQANAAFPAPYSGGNSLDPRPNAKETWDLTFYAGFSPWRGGEVWVNPEIDQGFGLSNTLGVAGFPSGEAYKVGKADPYFRLQRLFLRQTFDLPGETDKVDPDLNQLGGSQGANRIVITAGKFGVTDIFDTNKFAHDPRGDFMNWSLIDTGTFDYAADAWGYSAGAAVEWYQGKWTLRAGLFDLSDVPNSTRLDPEFRQFQLIAELERRYEVGGKAGVLKVTGFLSRGRMGAFADAIAIANATGAAADTALVRKYRGRAGVSFNLQQQLTEDLGLFVHGGTADGNIEPYEFADIDRTFAAGLSLTGKRWGRADDTVGLAGVVNAISAVHQSYLDAGGLGILVGDGRLPHPGDEQILETYYSLAVIKAVRVSFDYQYVANPAYNRDRGPVNLFAVRLHGQF